MAMIGLRVSSIAKVSVSGKYRIDLVLASLLSFIEVTIEDSRQIVADLWVLGSIAPIPVLLRSILEL